MSASMIVRLLTALAVFLIAFDGGGYALESRTTLAIAVWWTIALAFALGLVPRARVSLGARVTGVLLAGYTLVNLVSLAWAESDERAFVEFDRAALYLGVFVLAASLHRRWSAELVDGTAIGIAGVALLALVSRCLPGVVAGGDLPDFLPSAAARLSYPIGYWNGLAVLAALGVPLLLRGAAAATSPVFRGLAAGVLPALACVVFLASSRGAAAAGAIGTLAFLAFAARRWAVAGAIGVGAAGSAAGVAVLLARPDLVDGPLGSAAAVEQGRGAAVLLALVCAATGIAYGAGCKLISEPPRVPRSLGWVAAGLAVALALAGIAAAEPLQAFETFKQPPEFTQERPDLVRAHLLSGGGSGRWQFWKAAVDEFKTRPVVGRGAGSYEAWWARHGSLAYFVRDAHSLYAETLGELGLLGLGLLAGAFAVGLLTGIRALRRVEGRMSQAALAAAFVAYAFAAGIDWMWEMTVVSVVGIACLGLMLAAPAEGAPPVRRIPLTAIAVLVAVFAVAAQAVPLLAEVELDTSRAAVRQGDLKAARAHALRARDVQPWAASPYLQLALVAESSGDLRSARVRIGQATRRDAADWRLWLVAARLETKAGAVAGARASLAHARERNPRSPLFANAP